MTSPTVFLSPKYSPDSRIIRDAAFRKGWHVERLAKWSPPAFTPDGDIVLYGETLFCRFLAEHYDLKLVEPGDDFLPGLPEDLRKREIALMKLGEARAIESCRFIKPVNDKTFRASLFENGTLLPENIGEDEPVLVSEPVVFTCEFRFFMLNGRIMTGSLYSRFGELCEEGETPEELESAAAVASRAAAHTVSAVVIDTGHIEGRGWAVIEANPAWGSGLYLCDPEKVLDVLQKATEKNPAP